MKQVNELYIKFAYLMDIYFENVDLITLEKVADAIIEAGKGVEVWTFEGNLGSGKTTLIKLLADKLVINDVVTSPTFNYVNVYDDKVYHFDCYRLNTVDEALNLGLEEYLDSGKLCWIEWPEVILPLLNDGYLEIRISNNALGNRDYSISIK